MLLIWCLKYWQYHMVPHLQGTIDAKLCNQARHAPVWTHKLLEFLSLLNHWKCPILISLTFYNLQNTWIWRIQLKNWQRQTRSYFEGVKGVAALDLLWTNKWYSCSYALPIPILKRGNAIWFCLIILGQGEVKLTKLDLHKENQLAMPHCDLVRDRAYL